MKKLIYLIFCFALSTGAKAQKTNPNYDAKLAQKLGADDYGMRTYVLVILKTGTNTDTNKKTTDSLFRGHMANMNRMVKANQLIVAGPLSKNEQQYRGIFILNTKSIDEAREQLATDPAVQHKLLAADFYQWYGSAALAEYLKADDKVGKFKF